jgi:hypothetical protein
MDVLTFPNPKSNTKVLHDGNTELLRLEGAGRIKKAVVFPVAELGPEAEALLLARSCDGGV